MQTQVYNSQFLPYNPKDPEPSLEEDWGLQSHP